MPRQYIPPMAQGPAGIVPQRNDGIASLILNRGNIQADQADRSGSMWANIISGLGQYASGAIQANAQAKEEAKKKAILNAQDQAFLARISDTTKGPLQPAEALQIYGPERGAAIYKGYASMQSDKPDLKMILAGHKALSPEMQAQAWPKEHDLLVRAGVPVEQLPPPNQYSPEWVAKFESALQGDKAKAEPFTLTPGQTRFGPDGTPIANVPAEPKTPPRLPAEDAYIKSKYGDNPTPQQLLQGRSEFAAAGRDPRGPGAPGGAGGLDPDAVDYTATQYRILGPSGIPTRLGEADKVNIINAAAKQTKALGQTPAQAVQKQAAYKADGASLTKMTTMKGAAEAFENKAVSQADIVSELSKKVDRTRFQTINKALLGGKAEFGDTNTQLLFNALNTFTAEYAKIMEGSTGSAAGSSDAARRASDRLVSAYMKDGTVQATLDLMKREMRLTIGGYDATIEHITNRMGGAPSGPPGPAVPIPPPAAGGGPQKGERRVIQGKLAEWDGQGWMAVQ